MKKETVQVLPVPDKEAQRLEALQQYRIMDTLPEPEFDDLTRLASFICQTPISLMEADRQWIKSSVGLAVTETPRDGSFCHYALLDEKVYEVPDALENKLFANNLLVTGDPPIRFYAVAPLINPQGFRLGTLCVMDILSKTLNEGQRGALQILTRQVMTHLELRAQKQKLINCQFLVPVDSREFNSDSLASSGQANLQHVRLLLVEDNEVNQLVASKFLSKWGVRFDYANNGLVAVEKIKNNPYDIVLMDLQMPEMDGYEATKIIRSLDGTYYRELPIVALTASAMLDVQDKLFTVGMTDYLSKPFNPNELYNKISKYAKKVTLAEKPAIFSGLTPEVTVNFTQFTNATADNPDFARKMITFSIEALDNFKEQYRFALLNRDLAQLKSIRHKSHFLFHLLKLEQILNEIYYGEQLLKEGQAEEFALSESFSKVQMMCESVMATLKSTLTNLAMQ